MFSIHLAIVSHLFSMERAIFRKFALYEEYVHLQVVSHIVRH